VRVSKGHPEPSARGFNHRVPALHFRYSHFLPYGDAAAYRAKIDEVRQDFTDLLNRQ
jgi:hypothetical protein